MGERPAPQKIDMKTKSKTVTRKKRMPARTASPNARIWGTDVEFTVYFRKKTGRLVRCTASAHDGWVDNCPSCAPRWGFKEEIEPLLDAARVRELLAQGYTICSWDLADGVLKKFKACARHELVEYRGGGAGTTFLWPATK